MNGDRRMSVPGESHGLDHGRRRVDVDQHRVHGRAAHYVHGLHVNTHAVTVTTWDHQAGLLCLKYIELNEISMNGKFKRRHILCAFVKRF